MSVDCVESKCRVRAAIGNKECLHLVAFEHITPSLSFPHKPSAEICYLADSRDQGLYYIKEDVREHFDARNG